MTELYKALLKVQSQLGTITKNEKNPYFNSSYASLNAVREAIIKPLTDAELILLQPTVVQDGKTLVKTQIIHAPTGEMIEGFTEVLVKNATDAQQMGSGISYARRYGLMSLLCLAAEDDDGNGATEKQIKNETVMPPPPMPAKKISFSNRQRDEL